MPSEPHGNPKGFRRLPADDKLAPELRAAIQARRAERRTPEYQADLARDIESYHNEHPPARDLGLMKAFADLRRERARGGLSPSDMAERTGLDPETISNLETGKLANPTVSVITKYAMALGYDFSWTLVQHAAGDAFTDPEGWPKS